MDALATANQSEETKIRAYNVKFLQIILILFEQRKYDLIDQCRAGLPPVEQR